MVESHGILKNGTDVISGPAENEDKKINGGSVGTEKIDTTERQWPESQFVNKLLELTYLGNVWTSVSSKYNWIRGKYVFGFFLGRAESTAYWIEQKAEGVAASYRLDDLMKKVDSVAYNAVVKIEDKKKEYSKKEQIQTTTL